MGCGPSKPASPGADGAPRAAPASAATKPPVSQKMAAASSSAKPASNVSKQQYDSLSSASLVEAQTGGVAYHGLLADSGKLSLKRAQIHGDGKLFAKNVHPSDDSLQVPTSKDGCTVVTGVAMTMPYTIIVAGGGKENAVRDITAAIFDHANGVLNAWNPESEITVLNRAKPSKNVPLSSAMEKLFVVVDDVHSLTQGRFDPTTGVLTVAFENSITENRRPPLPAEISPFKHAIGWSKRIQRANRSVSRTNAHTVVDLDGIAKGYVVDLITDALIKSQFTDCYVDWAGDIRASGKHPSGRPWRSAVMRPPELKRVFNHWKEGTVKEMLKEDDIGYFADFAFSMDGEEYSDCAIATSGDYFAVQKYGYHHIASADIMSVMKASQISVGTVCIAARTCALADALATATMTYHNVDDAVAFLKEVRGNRRKDVYGFCVMGRKDLGDETIRTYTDSIFHPVEKSEAKSSSDGSGGLTSPDASRGDIHSVAVHQKTIRNRYRFTFNGKSIELDNFAPCSMEPEQAVAIVMPKDFVDTASTIEEDELNKFSCTILSPLSLESPSESKDTGIMVELQFKQISVFDSSALVLAVIETVSLEKAQPVEVLFSNRWIAKKEIDLGVARSKIQFLPLVNQVKTLFRLVPSMIWVVTATQADGSDMAFTATSVVVPNAAPNVLCLNISHSSVFFAGFGGVGSTMRGHALSTKQKDLAEFYVKNASLDSVDSSKLEADAMVTAHCTVEHVEDFQDHLIVYSEITRTETSSQVGLEPLVWQNGAFLN